jgi:hypothetical protein
MVLFSVGIYLQRPTCIENVGFLHGNIRQRRAAAPIAPHSRVLIPPCLSRRCLKRPRERQRTGGMRHAEIRVAQ